MKPKSRGRYWDIETRYSTSPTCKGFMGWTLYSRTGKDRHYTYMSHEWMLLIAYHRLSQAQQAYVMAVTESEGLI